MGKPNGMLDDVSDHLRSLRTLSPYIWCCSAITAKTIIKAFPFPLEGSTTVQVSTAGIIKYETPKGPMLLARVG